MNELYTSQSDTADRVAIVANPYSGSRHNRHYVQQLIDAIGRRGFDVQTMWQADQLQRAASEQDFAQRYRCIVAAGGDGTVHHIINNAIDVPLAVLPLGTENLVAKHFGFRNDPEKLAEAIQIGNARRIDLAKMVTSAGDQQRYCIVGSAGFDGDVAHRLARWRQRHDHLKRVRRLSYLLHIFRSTVRYDYPMMELEADGRTVAGSMTMVFNLPQYGFNFDLCPQAVDDDGLLDWIVFERPGRAALTRYWWALKRHRHLDLPDVHHGRAKHISIRCDQSVPFEVDGEEAGFAPLNIEAMSGAMEVIVLNK